MDPVIVDLVPGGANLGGPSFSLHVIGDHFTATDVIVWNGGVEPTTFVTANELTTGVNMATASVAMTIPVLVRTAGAVDSNVVTFSMRAAPVAYPPGPTTPGESNLRARR